MRCIVSDLAELHLSAHSLYLRRQLMQRLLAGLLEAWCGTRVKRSEVALPSLPV